MVISAAAFLLNGSAEWEVGNILVFLGSMETNIFCGFMSFLNTFSCYIWII
jgi:hypothetical protein